MEFKRLSKSPTTVVLTGSGNYQKPSGLKYIEIEMCGAGGSGTGSGTVGATNGNGGTNTTFNTTMLVAGGGQVGNYQGAGGDGGTNSYTAGPRIIADIQGGRGDGYFQTSAATAIAGGAGGVNPFGGGSGQVLSSITGNEGKDGTGAGGGGGATNNVAANYRGSGGGAGGYLRAIIPASLLSDLTPYAVGQGSGPGIAGTNGANGARGGHGTIRITEHY